MPTIGRATIDVDYDGKDMPRQARSIGEKAGEAHADAYNEELRRGAREANADLGREYEKGGKTAGERFGIRFNDSVEKLRRGELQKLSDDMARVFDDSNGVEKAVKKFKSVEDGTDHLRGSLAKLRLENVLTQEEFERLTGEVDGYQEHIEKTRKTQRDYIDQLKITSEEVERQRVAHDHLSASIENNARKAGAAIDELTDRQERDFEKRWGSSIDEAIRKSEEFRDRHRAAMLSAGDGFSSFDDRAKAYVTRVEEMGNVSDRSHRRVGLFGGAIRGVGDALRAGGRAVDDGVGALGRATASMGDESGIAAPKVGKLVKAFGQFDPGDNLGQLILLVIALLPQLSVLAQAAGAGVLILAGAATALALGLVASGVAFSNFFGDLKKVDPQVRPAAKALQDFIGRLGEVRSEIQRKIFTPEVTSQFEQFSTKLLGTLKSSFGKIAPYVSQVLLDISKDLNSSGFKKDFDDLFSGAGPIFTDLGTVARNTIGIIGQLLLDAMPFVKDFTGELKVATGKFLDFLKTPEGKNAVRKFFEDFTPVLKSVGDAVVLLAKEILKLATPKNIENTVKVLKELADAGPGIAKFASDLNGVIVGISGFVHFLGDVLGAIGDFFDGLFTAGDKMAVSINNLFSGLQVTIDAILQNLGGSFAAVGKAIGQAARGDFGGAAKTIGDAFEASRNRAKTAMDGLGVIVGDGAAKFRTLDASAQSSLTALATRFGIPQAKAAEFGGKIASLAQAAGVSISDIASAKGWDDLQGKTHAASGTIDELKRMFGQLPKDVSTNVKVDGATQGTSDVKLLKAGINGLVGKIISVKEDGSAGSKARVADLKRQVDQLVGKVVGVKEDGSTPAAARVKDLKGQITALTGKLVAVKEDGSAASEARVKSLKGQIAVLVGKIVKVSEDGAAAAKGRVDGLAGSINNLHGKTINISEVTTRYAKAGGTLGATGGMMVGGQLHQVGTKQFRRFASGGITNGTQYRGNAIVGEAGPEAIVPLSGALNRVDRSVRALSAFARGRTLTGLKTDQQSATRSGAYLEKGAIQVITSNANGRQVASAVIDRLDAAVG